MKSARYDHDVIVVGGRVAGAATAMLLGRRDHDVLVVDRAMPDAETLSTHALMKAGVLQLHRWGVLDRIIAAGTPAIRQTTFHYGDGEVVPIPFKPLRDTSMSGFYAPRRTLLDPVLVDAARASGASVEFGASVTGLLRDDDGRVVGIEGTAPDGSPMRKTARLVIGADGVRSRVARAVGALEYMTATHTSAVVYAYFDPIDVAGYEWFWTHGAAAGAIPTNDATLIWSGAPAPRMSAIGHDHERNFWTIFENAAPTLAPQVRDAARTSRWHAWAGHPGFHRRSWGPGWALVGDAAHFTDPISAHGISDALRDAEFLAIAVDSWLRNTATFTDALAGYEATRDRFAVPLFRAITRIAAFDWSLDEVRTRLLDASKVMQAETEALLGLEGTGMAA